MTRPTETIQPLLTPYRMGNLWLANRIVMAPLTRCRATNPGLVPTDLHTRYYAQRASAGLIITEGIWVSPEAVGWHDVPGLFSDDQIRGWVAVTDAVHERGGVIFAQLWHTGSASHPDFFGGRAPRGPSAVDPGLRSPTASGSKPTVTPGAMTRTDIASAIDDFATATVNALRAGFDGVQLQAGYNYLISQFLNPATNHRHDDHGGSIPNRARFLFDILDAIAARTDLARVGIKAGPSWAESGQFHSTAETLDTADYVANRLNDYPISHWMLMGAMADLTHTPLRVLQGDAMFGHFRPQFHGTLMANVAMTQERGNHLLAQNVADLIAYGQPFIANPDLPQRFAAHATLASADHTTYYTPGSRGYIDYPTLAGIGSGRTNPAVDAPPPR